jgi:hypothetical protein
MTTQTDGCCASEAANGHATGYSYDQDAYDQHQGGRVGRLRQCERMSLHGETVADSASESRPFATRQGGVCSV